MEGAKKPISFFFFIALTLKDTSLLMSQKALNNTTDQYISPLMGFSMGAVLAQSPVHTQTCEKKERKPTRAHTYQCTMWHMAASSTAESVKRKMEQWKRHTWGLITTLSSRLPRAQALISITLSFSPPIRLSFFRFFIFFSLPGHSTGTVSCGVWPQTDGALTDPSVALPREKQTVASCAPSFKHPNLICLECGGVSTPKCRVNRSDSFAPAATWIYGRFQLNF